MYSFFILFLTKNKAVSHFIFMFRLLLITTVLSSARSLSTSSTSAMALRSMDFEVFGRVQGVFFRKFTKDQADKLGLRGWCRNTAQGTVLGHMQGPTDKVENMVQWLKTTGSPSSQIDKAEFRNQQDINAFTFDNFVIKRDSE